MSTQIDPNNLKNWDFDKAKTISSNCLGTSRIPIHRVFALLFLVAFWFCQFKLFSEAKMAPKTYCQEEKRLQERIINEKTASLLAGSFGYTLIGEKPMSIEYCTQSDFSLYPAYRPLFFQHLEKILGNSNRFILEISHISPDYSEIVLVNIALMQKLVQKEPYLSHFVQKHYGSTQQFLQTPILERFRGDIVALGIALGYGEHNSRYYERYITVGQFLKKYPLVLSLSFDPIPQPENFISFPKECLKVPKKMAAPVFDSNKFSSLEAEWQWLHLSKNEKLKEFEVPYYFQPVFFISQKGPETEMLCKKYNRARNRLADLLENTTCEALFTAKESALSGK